MVAFFAFDRLVFMLIFHKKLTEIPFSEKLATFYHGLKLNFSMTTYITVFPLLYFLFFYL